MKILVFGADGQLGRALQKVQPNGIFLTHNDADIIDIETVVEVLNYHSPDIVVNAAGYTNVDMAETDYTQSYLVNGVGSANIAFVCQTLGIVFINISSDYVFDGQKISPYLPQDTTSPINMYGLSKLVGESLALYCERSYVVRTSWVYGEGHNFVNTMLILARHNERVQVVGDQIGLPTNTIDLARFCLFLAKKLPPFGIYHYCGSGDPISWAYFAKIIFEITQIDCEVVEVTTKQYNEGKNNIAPRPFYSVLDCEMTDKLIGGRRGWYAAILDYLKNN